MICSVLYLCPGRLFSSHMNIYGRTKGFLRENQIAILAILNSQRRSIAISGGLLYVSRLAAVTNKQHSFCQSLKHAENRIINTKACGQDDGICSDVMYVSLSIII